MRGNLIDPKLLEVQGLASVNRWLNTVDRLDNGHLLAMRNVRSHGVETALSSMLSSRRSAEEHSTARLQRGQISMLILCILRPTFPRAINVTARTHKYVFDLTATMCFDVLQKTS